MDEAHLAAALRYVALNPARARLVERAQDWRWSSATAHLTARPDGLTLLEPALDRFPRFGELLENDAREDEFTALRRAETIGRPLGDAAFLAGLEQALGRRLQAKRRGPKPKTKEPAERAQLSGLSP
jgi:putative transposase